MENRTINAETKERSILIDVIKGLLIIAVVVGHAASIKNPDLDNNIVFLCCYSWHMFLFLGVSGYLSGLSRVTGFLWIKKRFIRLMLPLVAWAILTTLISGRVSIFAIIEKTFIMPEYWYLLVLFIYDVIYYCTSTLEKGKLVIIILPFVIFLGLYKVYPCESLRQTLLYYSFFWGGVILAKRKSIRSILNRYKWGALVLFPLSMLLYSWKDYSHVEGIMRSLLETMSVSPSLIKSIIHFCESYGFRVYNHYVVSPLGCAFFICIGSILCHVATRCSMNPDTICYVGRNTIYIYILHKYLLDFGMRLYNSILLNTIVAIAICLAGSYIIKKVYIVDGVLFGGFRIGEPKNKER